MSKTFTLPNLCSHVRIAVDGKAFRVFSIKYTHPKETSEDEWTLLRGTTEHPIIVDKETMKMLAGHELQWLYKDDTTLNTEPSIMACEIVKKELDTI